MKEGHRAGLVLGPSLVIVSQLPHCIALLQSALSKRNLQQRRLTLSNGNTQPVQANWAQARAQGPGALLFSSLDTNTDTHR